MKMIVSLNIIFWALVGSSATQAPPLCGKFFFQNSLQELVDLNDLSRSQNLKAQKLFKAALKDSEVSSEKIEETLFFIYSSKQQNKRSFPKKAIHYFWKSLKDQMTIAIQVEATLRNFQKKLNLLLKPRNSFVTLKNRLKKISRLQFVSLEEMSDYQLQQLLDLNRQLSFEEIELYFGAIKPAFQVLLSNTRFFTLLYASALLTVHPEFLSPEIVKLPLLLTVTNSSIENAQRSLTPEQIKSRRLEAWEKSYSAFVLMSEDRNVDFLNNPEDRQNRENEMKRLDEIPLAKLYQIKLE